MDNWIYSVSENNWPIVAKEMVWAVDNHAKTRSVSRGDRVAFFVRGTGEIRGAFRVASDWHAPTVTWVDGGGWVAEITLEEIQMGTARIQEIKEKLDFIVKKTNYGIYLRGKPTGPSNFGKPVSDLDFGVIVDALENGTGPPGPATPGVTKPDVELFTDISKDHLADMRHNLDLSRPVSIKHIVGQVDGGKYAIPTFQREYAWSRRQIEELWESVFEGFFIGSILTWESADQVAAKQVSGGPELDEPSELVLDGQQRITSLYYAVANPESWMPDGKPIRFFVNLKALLSQNRDSSDIILSETEAVANRKGLLDRTVQFRKKLMPLTMLKDNFSVWVKDLADYLQRDEGMAKDKADTYYEQILQALTYAWSEYPIPVVKLPKSLKLNSVAEVFERINSRGTRLNVFDLLNARLTKYGIKLSDMLAEAKAEHPGIERMDKDVENAERYILQALCLYKSQRVSRKKILSLDDAYTLHQKFQNDEFIKDWRRVCAFTDEAINMLASVGPEGFGAVRLSMLPYTVTIPVLVALLCRIDGLPDAGVRRKKIRMWYWSVVTSDHYSSSTNTNVEKDYREILRWFDDEESAPEIVLEQRKLLEHMRFSATKRNDSVYKAIICLVAKAGAKDWIKNTGPESGEHGIHCIFPRSKQKDYREDVSIDSIMNKTILHGETNWNQIKNKRPSEYVRELIRLSSEPSVRRQLEAHLIPQDAMDAMAEDNFAEFVQKRQARVKGVLQGLVFTGMMPTSGSVRNLLYSVETKLLEYKETLRFDVRENRINKNLQKMVIKEVCAFMNSKGGDLLIGVTDEGVPVGIDRDLQSLGNSSDKFNNLITNMVSRHLGADKHDLITISFPTCDGKTVCHCAIRRSPTPVYYDTNELIIRTNSGIETLTGRDAINYVVRNFSHSHALV